MKHFRMIFLVSLFCFLFSLCAFAAGTVSVGSVTAQKGDTVEIPVTLSGNTGFASLGIEIGYDSSVLSLTGVTEGSVGATFTKSQTLTTNPYNLGWNCTDNNTFNGTLATLTFTVLTDVAGVYPVTVSYYKGRNGSYTDGFDVNYDENFDALGLSYKSGSVTVEGSTTPTVQVNIGNQSITLVSDNDTLSGAVLVAHYDSDGRMIELRSCPAASVITPDLSAPTSGDTVTALWWHDIDSMQPLANSGTVTIP
ncbi:MAG: hypothetical protein II359_00820 [Clostridia bacterium]|nr:hypothetical protein [Clostridia bacterium]